MHITNAFSLNMLAETPANIEVLDLSLDQVKSLIVGFVNLASNCEVPIADYGTVPFLKAVSAVGHADTASIFSGMLGVEVKPNRLSLSLKKGEQLIVGQYVGPRLPEGTTKLPEGSKIEWKLVSVR